MLKKMISKDKEIIFLQLLFAYILISWVDVD